MNELDIASFAESLVTESVTKGKPVQFSAPQAPDAPDVSDVEVPSDFASQVFSESHWDKADVEVSERIVEETVEKPKKQILPINEESVYKKHLLNEYKKKVADLEELVSIMEDMGMVGTTGRLGVGPMGGTQQRRTRKKKVGKPSRSNRRG